MECGRRVYVLALERAYDGVRLRGAIVGRAKLTCSQERSKGAGHERDVLLEIKVFTSGRRATSGRRGGPGKGTACAWERGHRA
jgi:hypothetical protein